MGRLLEMLKRRLPYKWHMRALDKMEEHSRDVSHDLTNLKARSEMLGRLMSREEVLGRMMTRMQQDRSDHRSENHDK